MLSGTFAFVVGDTPADPSLLVAVAVVLLAVVGAYVFMSRRSASSRTRGVANRPSQAQAVEVWADEGSPKVLVVNKSSRPVHDVRAFVAFGRRRADFVGWIRTLPPTGEDAAKMALTADGRETWIKWNAKKRNGRRAVMVECTFRDDQGQYWRRTPSGDVEPLRTDG